MARHDLLAVTYSDERQALRVFAIVSCKTSLRERYLQSLFWAVASLLSLHVRTAFVTLDRGRQGRSELGTCEEPSKQRKLCEAYFDRVYSFRRDTALCEMVRPAEDLVMDLRLWKKDTVPGSTVQNIASYLPDGLPKAADVSKPIGRVLDAALALGIS